MTLIITTHTNHSLGGAQCSSHTTGTIFRQAAASGFLFNASSQIFSERDSIYCREILAGRLFFLQGSRKGYEGPHTLNDAGVFQMARRVADATVG